MQYAEYSIQTNKSISACYTPFSYNHPQINFKRATAHIQQQRDAF
jgi:hypothetical protein